MRQASATRSFRPCGTPSGPVHVHRDGLPGINLQLGARAKVTSALATWLPPTQQIDNWIGFSETVTVHQEN